MKVMQPLLLVASCCLADVARCDEPPLLTAAQASSAITQVDAIKRGTIHVPASMAGANVTPFPLIIVFGPGPCLSDVVDLRNLVKARMECGTLPEKHRMPRLDAALDALVSGRKDGTTVVVAYPIALASRCRPCTGALDQVRAALSARGVAATVVQADLMLYETGGR